MRRRTITQDERKEFEAAFGEARPLAPKAIERTRQERRPGAKPALTGGLDGRTAERLRRGLIEPRAKLDLHGYTEEAAHRALLVFLKDARVRGHRLVLVVTGRGSRSDDEAAFRLDFARGPRGVLNAAVPRWLKESEFAGLIAGTQTAHRHHGGDGALYIYLRKKPS